MAAAELVVVGGRPLRGTLRVPGDKSISHRALLFAAVASGPSRLSHLADGDDVQGTRRALEGLGVSVRGAGDLTVGGRGLDSWQEPESVIDCGNSGTTIRILTGLLAGRRFHSVLTGDASLRTRPMARVVEPLRAMGAEIDGRANASLAPLSIRGGPLTGRRHDLPLASAQVKSALLLAGLQADGVTEVHEPAPSRDHTERMLAALGAPLRRLPDGAAAVEAGTLEPFQLDVPGDPSSAAFFAVAASIVPGSRVVLERLALNPTRIGFVAVLARMGANVDVVPTGEVLGEPIGDVTVTAAALHATSIAGGEIPTVIDELPALAVAAAYAEGTSEIRDAAELRVKESDRIGTIHQELTELGIEADTRSDGLVIRGGQPRSSRFKSHGDHRVGMAAAVAAAGADGESTVRGWGAVTSSYPGFGDDLERLTVDGA
ncbi:MAG: 3-phosphoshikimate 1-carboxyvinyltransferase [Acidimicrobiia bacterium]